MEYTDLQNVERIAMREADKFKKFLELVNQGRSPEFAKLIANISWKKIRSYTALMNKYQTIREQEANETDGPRS